MERFATRRRSGYVLGSAAIVTVFCLFHTSIFGGSQKTHGGQKLIHYNIDYHHADNILTAGYESTKGFPCPTLRHLRNTNSIPNKQKDIILQYGSRRS
jgi:hypothetical protein